ncbi:MAG: Eco57I restriction-modification methylase domain-containing protein [Prevotellaceae bacterium]|jgi:hypothetical protein|nr:Eco57I restriction-modification methylase domain-containing protein [Prevotellaceae bacterium]
MIKKLKQSLNAAFLKQKTDRSEIELFKKEFISLLDKINVKESEEFHKNIITEFLNSVYYKDKHYINTKGYADLVIHNGKDAQSPVGVLIEVKSPVNKTEMVSKDNLNVKSFQELVLYYLKERKTEKNFELRYLIITNIYEWFVFDAHDFEKLFYQNNKLLKHFDEFKAEKLSGKNTDFFYKEIASPEIEKIQSEITYTHFDIRDYDNILRNADKEDDKKLIALYKFLSPVHLLKLSFANDANELNKEFYAELLYILGLEEVKRGTQKFIERKREGERDSASIIENAIERLDIKNKLNNIPNVGHYGNNKEEQLFHLALNLSITWINRVLFLKLLESQIIKYNKNNKDFAFISAEKLIDYDDLDSLFFSVLARKINDRTHELKEKYKHVPYLNSSLFEITDIEDKTICIDSLQDSVKIKLYSKSILKNKKENQINESLRPLEYLLRFLDAYDFSSEGSEDILEENKPLISASVLGLIFEKINGYKDGSFFTPSFITMYMCNETISQVIIRKFNETKNWNCQSIIELHNKIDDITEANKIFNSVRICDPAVGSGHFLVSALNEMIALKSELGILVDETGKRLKGYNITIEHDELNIRDENGEIFQYNSRNDESSRVQKTLFCEKQTIIENCLFGVDINHNSVKICQLRLWIELLKHTYYKKGTNDLETLPNIDINIKCGNSLISRFDILDNNSKLPNITKQKLTLATRQYKEQVIIYKITDDKAVKKQTEKRISEIKETFSQIANPYDEDYKKLKQAEAKLSEQFIDFDLAYKEIWQKKIEQQNKETKELREKYEQKLKTIYANAFEWRFEFPEVLNEDGDFVGFDAIIGNPPYISTKDINAIDKKALETEYGFADDTYNHFFFQGIKLLKDNGLLNYITPKTYWTTQTKRNLRNILLSKKINYIFDVADPFEEAMVDTCITSVKNTETKDNQIRFLDGSKDLTNPQEYVISQNIYLNTQNSVIFKPTIENLKIYELYGQKVKELYNTWWDKIKTSRDIEKNSKVLEEYRNNLKPGDVALLGCLTEGGQGLATANNGKYIAVRKSTKWAKNIIESRPKKLAEAISKHKIKIDIFENFTNITDYLRNLNEKEIAILFDELKEKYGRDIFGQGYLYRLIEDEEIADVDTLTEDEKTNGIPETKNYYVPYDKGDKDGNRWYLETPFAIAWTQKNVGFLKADSNARYQGYTFYFKEGFCWSAVNGTRSSNELKFRFKQKSITDVQGMSLHCVANCVSSKYITCLCNADFISRYTESYVNSTVIFQINDARQIPVIIPTKEQLREFEKLFDFAFKIKKNQLSNQTAEKEEEKILLEIQKKLDTMIRKLYGI